MSQQIKKIKKMIAEKAYENADIELKRCLKNGFKYDVTMAILEGSIAEGLGDRKRFWKAISEGLKKNPENYELYVMLGNYYLSENPRKTYLCYENALFYCNHKQDAMQIKQLLEDLCQIYEVRVPKTAIVLLSYNLLNDTKECIDSIRKTIPESAREIIVVDNASEDGSAEWLKKQKDIKLLCNNENVGFPKGCNQGIELAQKDADIFLLNNDTLLMKNALFWLRMGLYEEERNGSAGCVSNYVSNFQAVIENGKTKNEYIRFAQKTNVPMENPYLNKVHLVGFALLIKREVLNKTGGAG